MYNKIIILILIFQIDLYTEQINFHEDSSIYSIFKKINIKTNKKVLLLKDKKNINLEKIDYDYLIIEIPNKKLNINKLDINKPTLIILNNNKKEIKLLIKYLKYFKNIQFYIGNVFNLEMENNIEKIINNFVKNKKISQSYKFSQKKIKIIINNNKKSKLFYLISNNYFITKYCKNKCILEKLTYIKYIFSNKKIYKNNMSIKKLTELENLIQKKSYLNALLLLFEIKSNENYKKLKFKNLENYLYNKVKIKEPYLKNLENI